MNLERVIQGCIKKDRVAEKELYQYYARYIYNICLRYSNDSSQAEDYMQDSFIKIFNNLKKYDHEKGQFKSWVSRLVVNTIISDKRKKNLNIESLQENLNVKLMPATKEEDSDDILNEEFNHKELLDAIKQLPMNYRDVLNLHVFEELKHNEIAQLMDLKAGSVRSRFSRAKKMLKEILSKKMTNVL